MLRNDERWVVFMEFNFHWSPAYAPPDLFDVKAMGGALEEVVNATDSLIYVDPRNKDEAVTLDSVTYYPPSRPEYLVLLFSYSNVRGADPGFKNLKTRKNRVEKKQLDEAVAASAHLVISLKQKARKGDHYYPALLEDVGGIGKTKIQAALTAMVRGRRNFTFVDEDGRNRAATIHTELLGLDDETVKADASGGRMSYFVAIKENKNPPLFDEGLGIRQTRQEVRLKPAKDAVPTTLKDMLTKLAAAAKRKGYDRVRVHYVRQDGKNRSLTFGTHREDAEDFLIKRVEKIKLKSTVGQTHDEPNEELVKAMVGHLRG